MKRRASLSLDGLQRIEAALEAQAQKAAEAYRKVSTGMFVPKTVETTEPTRRLQGHPGVAARQVTMDVLSEFELPRVSLTFQGQDRLAGRGAHEMTEGTLKVQATLYPRRGASTNILIPIRVRTGQMILPDVMYHKGVPHIICQSAFDDILKQGALGPEHSKGPESDMGLPDFGREANDAMYGAVDSGGREIQEMPETDGMELEAEGMELEAEPTRTPMQKEMDPVKHMREMEEIRMREERSRQRRLNPNKGLPQGVTMPLVKGNPIV